MPAPFDLGDERLQNSFLSAILPGGLLHEAFVSRFPFNTVFVPSQHRLRELDLVKILESPLPSDYSPSLHSSSEGLTSKELADGYISHSAVPSSRVRHFLGSFLDNHLAHFDDFGLGEAFTLSNGIRGRISEGLDKISVSGRLWRINITAHAPPDTTVSQTASAPFSIPPPVSLPLSSEDRLAHLRCLNLIFLEDSVVEAYDVRRILLPSHTAKADPPGDSGVEQGPKEPSPRLAPESNAVDLEVVPELQVSTKPSGGISKVIDGLLSSWRGGSASATPIEPPTNVAANKLPSEHHPAQTSGAKSDPQANFKEFQANMQRPECKHLARCVTAFVDYCNNATSLASGASGTVSAVPGASPANKPVSPNEVRSVIDQLMKIIHTMQRNGEAGGDLWKGKEEEVALEGFEKYILTKIYARTFAFYPKEREEAALLHSRVAAFRGVVSEHTFDIVPPVKFKLMDDTPSIVSPEDLALLRPSGQIGLCSKTPHWLKAVEELRAMSSYKCPRDKLMCGINACKLVVKALDTVSAAALAERRRLEMLEKQLRNGPPPTPSNRAPDSTSPERSPNELASSENPSGAATTADTFIPALFLLVAHANPEYYLCNMRFIDRYRHRTFLEGDSGYLLTCLLSTVDFWQNCGHEELGIDKAIYDSALSKLGSIAPAPKTTTGNNAASSDNEPSNSVCSPITPCVEVPSADASPSLPQAHSTKAPTPSSHMDPFDDFFNGPTQNRPAPREDDGVMAPSRTSYPPYDPAAPDPQLPRHHHQYPPLPNQKVSEARGGGSPQPPQSNSTSPTDQTIKNAVMKFSGPGGFDELSVTELRALAGEAVRLRRLLDLD